MNFKLSGAVALCLASSFLSTHAFAQTARNAKAVAVPVKNPVTLDGDLKEWDWSGAVESQYDGALAPRFTTQFAFQYDAGALYFGAKVNDETPMKNAHDPRIEPGNGWDGDAIQLRLTAAPEMPYPLTASVFDLNEPNTQSKDDRIVHFTIWNFAGKTDEPVVAMQRGMDYHGAQLLIGKESGVAFKKWPDGKGYNVEARFPWKLLGVKGGQAPPKAGDKVALTVQMLWGNADGSKQVMSFNDIVTGAGFHFQSAAQWGRLEFLSKGDLAPSQKALSGNQVQMPLSFSVPVKDADARVLSLGVWNDKNQLVRTLPTLTDFKIENGKVPVRWDGLDDDGKVLAPGKYAVKYLTNRGVDTKWLTSLNTAGTPPWKTGDGTGAWGADHGPPLAAASDGKRVYLGWQVSEAGFSLVGAKQELKADRFNDLKPQKLWGSVGSLDIGINVQALATNGDILFVAQDGKIFGQHSDPNATNFGGVLLWDAATGRPINFPFGKRVLKVSEWKPRAGDDSLEMNVFAIATRGDDLFVALHHDGKVLRYNWKSGEQTASWDVSSPRGLAIAADGTLRVLSQSSLLKLDPQSGAQTALTQNLSDPYGIVIAKNGEMLVSDGGTSQQVKIFNAAGKQVGSLGKAGGRNPVGRYDASGMWNPAGLTVDGEGKIWVTENNNVPRRISVWSRDGKLLADLIGPGSYAVKGNADPQNPRRVATMGAIYDVDYATGKSTLLGVPVVFDRHAPRLVADRADYEFHHANGRTYLSHHGQTLYLLDEKTLIARPVASVHADIVNFFDVKEAMFPAGEREAIRKMLTETDYGRYVWTDRNGDGLMQPAEFTPSQAPERIGFYWSPTFDKDLTLWTAAEYGTGNMYRIPVKRFLPDGTPDYGDLQGLKPLVVTRGAGEIFSVLPSLDEKSFYDVEKAGKDDAYQAIARYDVDGKQRWAYRRTWVGFALTSPLFRPGMVIGAMKLMGVAPSDKVGEIVGVNGYQGQFNLLSGDGLWIGALGTDNRYSPENSDKTYFVENFSGWFFRNEENKKYYLIAGETDTRISEITGLETIQTGEAPLVLSDDDTNLARTALASRNLQTGAAGVLALRALTPTVDGNLDEWKMPETAQIDADAGRAAKVALGYDAQNLYLAFDVTDGSPLKNAGGDFAMLFKTGDSVNLNLATNPDADSNRTKPVAGDIRVLLTETPDGMTAVLYEPVASPGVEKAPKNFTSPTGNETFERVVKIPDAKIVVTRRDQGYTLEAALPLAQLGFKPQAGQSYKADAGVLFSTPGGNAVGFRAYIFNKDTQITQDVPTEARLEPNQWGTVKAE